VTDTAPRIYRTEPLSGLTPFLIAAKLTEWERNGWRLAAFLPFAVGYAVNDLHALLYQVAPAKEAT
jgi:hypothetical protein